MSKASAKTGFAWSLWLWVILAFALVIAAWTAFIVLAARHPVESVPLEPETATSPATAEPSKS